LQPFRNSKNSSPRAEHLDALIPAARPLRVAIAALVVLPITLMPLRAAAQERSIAARLEQAAMLIANNQIAEAEIQLNRILRVRPNEATALNLLGTVRARQGRLDEAERLFSHAVQADSRLVGAHMNLAYLYLLKGAPDKTSAELKTVLSLDPTNADATYRLSWLLLNQGHLDECLDLVERSKKNQRPSPALLVVEGDAFFRRADLQKAEQSYLAALHQQADNADALLGLASIYRAGDEDEKAKLYLGRAKKALDGSPDQMYKFALVAIDLQMPSEALPMLQQAIKLRSSEASYQFLLGVAWLKKVELQEAEDAFRQTLKLRADDPQAQMYLGYTLLKEKKSSEARAWLEKSIEKEGVFPEPYYYLGLIAQDQGEDQRAIQMFEKAIKISPDFGHPHVALGVVFLKLKSYERAQQELETGAKLIPNDSKAHYNLALLFSRTQNNQRAQEEMQIVQKLKSTEAQMKEAELVAPSSPRPR
jgi:tetratricopeptide (TPR) repeat protein